MLSQLERLSREVDGRYASDAELTFMIDYVRSFNLRVQTYQKLQELESTIIQQTYNRMRSIDPQIFVGVNREDLTRKCLYDMTCGLRATATAVLLNDLDTLQERLLFWLQTIMRSLGKTHTCDVLYSSLQEVVKQHLTPPQANLVCPILELNRRILGSVT
ncbi:MAG: phycobilisome protein [Elainella sp. Prado103]|nr:phycobilisome protein [Elainella sp. Prado103]